MSGCSHRVRPEVVCALYTLVRSLPVTLVRPYRIFPKKITHDKRPVVLGRCVVLTFFDQDYTLAVPTALLYVITYKSLVWALAQVKVYKAFLYLSTLA